MIRIFGVMAVLALLGACQTTVNPSESHYRSSEAMRSASVERCRVLEVRQISIGAESYRGGFARSMGQPEEQIGSLLGVALGVAVGRQIGSGSGRQMATLIGTVAGGAIGRAQGSKMAQQRMTQSGLEYSILTASGREEVIVQHHNPGDRIATPGSTCRIAGTGNNKRILPGDHLPARISRPAQTSFY